jgi:hypothetical protein
MIVSVVSGPNGHYLVSTNRRRNSVRELPSGIEIANWPGKEVTAACCVDDNIVCAALDGRLYVVAKTGVETFKHSETAAWWYSGASIGSGTCLFGGSLGRLLFFDARHREFRHDALRKHDIDRPGRDILHILKHEDVLFLLGTKEFLIRYHADSFTSCLGPPLSETSFESAVWLKDKLWIVARLAGYNVLVEYEPASGALVRHPLEIFPPLYRPAIAAWNSQLCLGRDEVYRGHPGAWVKIAEKGKYPLTDLLPAPGRLDALLAVDTKGQARLIAV